MGQSGFLKAWAEQETVKPVSPRALNKNDCDDDGEEDDDEEEEGLTKKGDDDQRINDKNGNQDGDRDNTKKNQEEKFTEGEPAEAGRIAGDERSSRPPPANPVHAPCAPGWGPLVIGNRPGLGVSHCPIGRAWATELHCFG